MKKTIEKKEEVKEEVKKEETKTSCIVTYRLGTREYTKELNGENFMELAKQFCEKQKGTIA